MKQTKFLGYPLAIAGLSLFSAACIVILVVFVPMWQNTYPGEFLQWFSDHGKTVGMIMLPLEIAPLVLTLICYLKLRRIKGTGSMALLLANLCNFAILYMFIVYFLPLNASFMDNSIPVKDVSDALKYWESLHTIRTILSLVAVMLVVGFTEKEPRVSDYLQGKASVDASPESS